ncbi:hypothetical protein SAMD00019534_105050, partial [Acytostelium subglobosum LB1]|uniref:hypothetical protein n=1 Tax=Acytostelium subglobosum LB1 TaxID=1410327 RepID=UPI000644A810
WDFYQDRATILNDGELVSLSGTLVPPGHTWPYMEAKLVLRRAKGSFMPKQELKPSAYVPYGPVDPQLWTYYTLESSTIECFGGEIDGMTIELSEHMDMPMQVGIGASGKNVVNGLSSWYNFKFMKNGQVVYTSDQVVDINVDIDCSDCEYDRYHAKAAAAQSIWINAEDLTPFGGYNSWDFIDNRGEVSLNPDYSITVSGIFGSTTNDTIPIMNCNFEFIPDIQTFRSMKLELAEQVYFPTGPVDVGTWFYYRVNPAKSSCIMYNGYLVTIVDDKNMPAQVGYGANGKNQNFGLSVWMNVMDINIDMECINIPPPTIPPTQPPTAPPTTPPTQPPTAPPTAPPTQPPTQPP